MNTLLIIIYLVGYALSVVLGRKFLKTCPESELDIGDFTFIFSMSIFSWLNVIALITFLVPRNNKPAPKWFR